MRRNAINSLVDGKQIVSCSNDGTIKIHEISSGKCIQSFADHSDAVLSIAIIDNLIVSGSKDNTVKVFQMANVGKCIRSLIGHTACVKQVMIQKKKKKYKIVSLDSANFLKIWDLSDNTTPCKVTFNAGFAVHAFEWDTDKVIVAGGTCIKIYDEANGAMLSTFSISSQITCIERYNRKIAVGDTSGTVTVFDIVTNSLIFKCTAHNRRIHGIQLDDVKVIHTTR